MYNIIIYTCTYRCMFINVAWIQQYIPLAHAVGGVHQLQHVYAVDPFPTDTCTHVSADGRTCAEYQ